MIFFNGVDCVLVKHIEKRNIEVREKVNQKEGRKKERKKNHNMEGYNSWWLSQN
jgi:hypothetical protein